MIPRPPIFPDTEAFARAFYGEAVRHLEDAKTLHEASRFAASITSTAKASELGLKATFILENAVGYWEKIYATHKPLTDAATHPLLNRVPATIEAQRERITFDIRELELLKPTQFGKKFYGPEEANVEYPFLMMAIDDSGGSYAELNSPALYFQDAQSLKLYRLAHELLTLLPTLYIGIAAWGIPLPPAL